MHSFYLSHSATIALSIIRDMLTAAMDIVVTFWGAAIFSTFGLGDAKRMLTPGRDGCSNRSSLRRLIRTLACGLELHDHPFFGRSDGRVGFPQGSALWVIGIGERTPAFACHAQIA
jgi:hypothetical protein